MIDYKWIIRNYLDVHKVSSFDVEKIEDKLKHCCTDDEVYLRMSQLETKVRFDNCKLRGFNDFEPDREFEFILYHIMEELDKFKKRKRGGHES